MPIHFSLFCVALIAAQVSAHGWVSKIEAFVLFVLGTIGLTYYTVTGKNTRLGTRGRTFTFLRNVLVLKLSCCSSEQDFKSANNDFPTRWVAQTTVRGTADPTSWHPVFVNQSMFDVKVISVRLRRLSG